MLKIFRDVLWPFYDIICKPNMACLSVYQKHNSYYIFHAMFTHEGVPWAFGLETLSGVQLPFSATHKKLQIYTIKESVETVDWEAVWGKPIQRFKSSHQLFHYKYSENISEMISCESYSKPLLQLLPVPKDSNLLTYTMWPKVCEDPTITFVCFLNILFQT